MTAWSSVDLAVEAMRMGVCDFVQKPWENTRLLETLRVQIERGQSRRRNLRIEEEHVQELEEAREIDRGLLPQSLPPVEACSFSGARLSARSVGGDYFDLLTLDDNRAALCIADVIGKGIPAALLMSNLQAAVRTQAHDNPIPSELCSRLNKSMFRNMPPGKFITFFYGLLDTARRTLTYTNAGHSLPILLRQDGQVLRLDAGGMVLGVFQDSPYAQGEVKLESGDRLVLFTDGVTEARNADGDEFGDERLIRLLDANRTLSPAELKSKVMEAIAEFSNGDLQDDATLLVMAVE